MNGRYLIKMALRALIGAVGISAALGIYALLRQGLDEWSAKTLGTTLFVSAASVLIMANAASLERRSVGYFLISGAGLLAALAALPISLYALWTETDADGVWRSAASLEIISVFAGHSSLLSLRQISGRYRWLKPVATLLAGGLAALVIWMIWADEFESAEWRAAGVLAILLLSVTVVIPILSRLVALDDPPRAGCQGSDDVGYCPNCGSAVRASGRKGRCGACGARFAVKFDARR
jgi:hypothetical protein